MVGRFQFLLFVAVRSVLGLNFSTLLVYSLQRVSLLTRNGVAVRISDRGDESVTSR